MAALARVISRAFPAKISVTDALNELALVGAAGLFVSLLLATYGLDLSAGFF
jgi:hypothetical protein